MIPKKIHLCWLSGDPYPSLIKHCITSWEKHLADYEIIIWDRQKINIEQIPWVKEAFEQKKYAFAADYIRLYAVYTEGGIYLDSDVEVISNFDKLLSNNSFMGLETEGDFDAAVFGAEVGCQWVGKCLDYYDERHFVQPNGSLDIRPLPTIVGEIMKKEYNIAPISDGQIHDCKSIAMTVYPSEYFSPKSTHTNKIKKTKNTICIHHFDGAWVSKDWKYQVKNTIHKCLIIVFGQKGHNRIVNLLRSNGKV